MLVCKEAVILYPYHNRIRQRIRQGELIGYEYTENHPRIGRCLLLYFATPPFTRPIRPHKWAEYQPLLARWEKEQRS